MKTYQTKPTIFAIFLDGKPDSVYISEDPFSFLVKYIDKLGDDFTYCVKFCVNSCLLLYFYTLKREKA